MCVQNNRKNNHYFNNCLKTYVNPNITCLSEY